MLLVVVLFVVVVVLVLVVLVVDYSTTYDKETVYSPSLTTIIVWSEEPSGAWIQQVIQVLLEIP